MVPNKGKIETKIGNFCSGNTKNGKFRKNALHEFQKNAILPSDKQNQQLIRGSLTMKMLFYVMCACCLANANIPDNIPTGTNISILFSNSKSGQKDSKIVDKSDDRERIVYILSKLEINPYYNSRRKINQKIKIYIVSPGKEISISSITSKTLRMSSSYYILPDDLYEELLVICKKYVVE